MNKLILIIFCLLTMFSCDEAEELLEGESLTISGGTYTVTDAMLYPNADCSGTPSYGTCNADESVTIESDCPDNSWESHISEFDGWSLMFLDDNATVILDDGMKTDTLSRTN